MALAVVTPSPAEAHPLGNFTVNRYAKVQPSAGVMRVTYVLDLAEIPAFQEKRRMGSDTDAYARSMADGIGNNLRLTVDGSPVPLARTSYLLSQPPGQGGLPTLRLAALYEAPLSSAPNVRSAAFEDLNEPDRIGWREIVASPQGNAQVSNATVPARDVSDELREYPDDLLQAPLDRRRAEFSFTPGTITVSPPVLEAPDDATERSGDGFTRLIEQNNLGVLAFLGAMALAVGFGAVHGLAPGHGKSVMAAYLVGTRGRPIDAVLLGVVVSIMHTGSVLVIGLILLQLGVDSDISAVYPVLTLISGVVVVALGLWLMISRLRKRSHDHDHAHTHDHDHAHTHDHDHAHTHDHDHAHTHDHDHGSTRTLVHDHGFGSHSHELPDGVAPLSRRGLLLLATSGGLLPSPSAIVVLVGAASLGRLGLGLSLIGAFSIGLAGVLTIIGLGLVYGRSFVERKRGSHRIIRLLPVLSAVGLVFAGLVVMARGLTEL